MAAEAAVAKMPARVADGVARDRVPQVAADMAPAENPDPGVPAVDRHTVIALDRWQDGTYFKDHSLGHEDHRRCRVLIALGTLAEGFDYVTGSGADERDAPFDDVELDLIGRPTFVRGGEDSPVGVAEGGGAAAMESATVAMAQAGKAVADPDAARRRRRALEENRVGEASAQCDQLAAGGHPGKRPEGTAVDAVFDGYGGAESAIRLGDVHPEADRTKPGRGESQPALVALGGRSSGRPLRVRSWGGENRRGADRAQRHPDPIAHR